MSRLDLIAETTKLARLLHHEDADLEYLHKLGPARMRELRERANAALFDETQHMFQRVALASKLIPVPAIALIGEKVFGPLLCARVAGLLAPERALDVAMKLPDHFLADVAVQLDPRSAREVIGKMPAKRVAAVALILVQRRDFVTMGRFVDYLSRETIKQVMESIRDDAALLHVAFYVESKEKLNDLVSLMPLERLRQIVVMAGAEGSQLWVEALALMSHLSADWQRRIGDLAAEQDEAVLTRMLRTAHQLNLWDSLLPVVGAMSLPSRQKLARLPALAEVELLDNVLRTADREQLWEPLLPLVSEMSEATRHAVARTLDRLAPEVQQRLLDAVNQYGLWDDLVKMMEAMDDAERTSIAQLISRQDESLLNELLKRTHDSQLWPKFLPLLAKMPEAGLTRLNQLATKLGLTWKQYG